MKNNLVSIIVPTYNVERFIEGTIQSIQAQTYPHWELLLTDDCSTDATVSIIKKYSEKDHRIKLHIFKKGKGAGVARNNSIKRAQGRFIAFLDSDDRWLPTKLEEQISFMVKNDYAFTFTAFATCWEDDTIIETVSCPKRISYWQSLADNKVRTLTVIYDRRLLGKLYMVAIRSRQDWVLWLTILKKVKYGYGLQKTLAIYRYTSNSLSSSKLRLLKYNFLVYHKYEKFSYPVSLLMLCFYFLPSYFFKVLKQKLT